MAGETIDDLASTMEGEYRLKYSDGYSGDSIAGSVGCLGGFAGFLVTTLGVGAHQYFTTMATIPSHDIADVLVVAVASGLPAVLAGLGGGVVGSAIGYAVGKISDIMHDAD